MKRITINDAIKILSSYVNYDKEMGDKLLLVTTSDRSIGGRASVEIKGIYQGFDWEHGQIRIETDEQIVKKYNDRDIEKDKWLFTERITNKKYSVCPCCTYRVGKKDNYCKHCGQKLSNELINRDYML